MTRKIALVILILTSIVSVGNNAQQAGATVSTVRIPALPAVRPSKSLVAVSSTLTAAASNRALGHYIIISQGWGESGFNCVDYIVQHESGWSASAHNRSGAHGIPQALPGRKMASFGSDWRWNPRTQIAWMVSYIKGRYHSACNAARFKRAHGWY